MIAEVVLNSITRATDGVYHYLIPENLSDVVKVGVRVIVPFGRGNRKLEAYVLALTDFSEFKNLKEIAEVTDDYSYFDEKQAELIKFMSHRYFCSLISAIKAVVPSGVGIRIKKIVTRIENISEDAKKYLEHSLSADAVYKLLGNGARLSEEITDETGIKNVSVLLKTMVQKGIVTVEEKQYEAIKDTVQTRVTLDVDTFEVIDAIEVMQKKAPARARCLEVMLDNRDISLHELLEYADTSRNVVKTLEAKGFLSLYETVYRENLFEQLYEVEHKKHKLTQEQEAVFDRVFESIKNNEKQTFLLNGVTGSGKTEVYLNLIEKTVSLGKQAVFLVPEISLTPQMVSLVISRFGDRVAVFHSSLTQKQRYEQWKNIKDGNADIVVGARSAVFAPFNNLGLIIIDEEHENTYKSEMSPKYNTVEIARFRARQNSAVVLLASATPLVESTYRSETGKYTPLFMPTRVNDSKLPETEIVDMRIEMAKGNMSIFSRRLLEEIEINLNNNKQTILFINRRGFSSFVSCRSCGYVMECPNCNVSLTYHKSISKMVCHYCDYVEKVPTVCPSCESKYIKYFGVGTQRIEEELGKFFPDARVIRMDADTTAARMSHEILLDKFKNYEADILIGTQMITKGLDFENVTLVGIVAADMSLNVDDYRAAERTFDLVTQVSGRAGRGAYEGRAIIQTYNPENETIQSASRQDYEEFYRDEIELRKMLVYPPFCEFLNFVFVSQDKYKAEKTAKRFWHDIKNISGDFQVMLYHVSEAPLFKINNKYRYRFLIKSRYSKEFYDCIGALYKKYVSERNSCQIIIDVNPSNMY